MADIDMNVIHLDKVQSTSFHIIHTVNKGP